MPGFNLVKVLKSCELFKLFSEKDIVSALKTSSCRLASFKRGQLVALEGEECSDIGIVLEGKIEVQKNYASGKTVTIDRLQEGELFGQVVIFSEMQKYPSTILAAEEATILFLSKGDIIKLCSTNPRILQNFMTTLSNKILLLNRKITSLSYQTIRQQVANHLLEEYAKQKSRIITLSCNRSELAAQLGIPRPSLSRELANMRRDNLINYKKNKLEIIDLAALENLLYE